jgi:molecular chaperone DnaK
VDKLNTADAMIFNTEKQLKEYGDKIPADKKASIENVLGSLKEAHKNKDFAGIDAAMNEMNQLWQSISQEMYNAQNQQSQSQQAGPEPESGEPKKDEPVTDVDFEEVK